MEKAATSSNRIVLENIAWDGNKISRRSRNSSRNNVRGGKSISMNEVEGGVRDDAKVSQGASVIAAGVMNVDGPVLRGVVHHTDVVLVSTGALLIDVAINHALDRGK